MGWRLVLEKIPLMVLVAVLCGIVVTTHASFRLISTVDRLPLATRLVNALISYAAYVCQSVVPVDLALSYPHLGTRLPLAQTLGSLILLLAITAVALYGWRRRPYVLVGWLWFLGMLVPVIGLVQFSNHARADRYTYLSQIGLSIALAWCVWSVYQSRQSSQPLRWRRWMLAALSGMSVFVLAAVAWRQTSYWCDTETLWMHTIACTGPNRIAQTNLAGVCLADGRIDEAVAHFREAFKEELVDPEMLAMSHLILADVLNDHGRFDEAITDYEETVRLYPAGELGHVRFATALAAAGQHDRALVEWRESVRLAPTDMGARIGLADALLAVGDAGEAVTQCREVLKQAPDAGEAIVILAMALAAEGKVEEAIPRFERVLNLDPRNVRAHFHLGLALYDRGQSQSAVSHLGEAIRLGPMMSRCCCKPLGFWRRVRTLRLAMERGRSNWRSGRLGLPTAEIRAPWIHLLPRWPKRRSSPRPSTLPNKRRRLPSPAATPRLPTRSTSGRVFTARACRIASPRWRRLPISLRRPRSSKYQPFAAGC